MVVGVFAMVGGVPDYQPCYAEGTYGGESSSKSKGVTRKQRGGHRTKIAGGRAETDAWGRVFGYSASTRTVPYPTQPLDHRIRGYTIFPEGTLYQNLVGPADWPSRNRLSIGL